jgi:streptomycin 6-kinase
VTCSTSTPWRRRTDQRLGRYQHEDVSVRVPTGLRQAVIDDEGGQEWLDSLPARAARAAERWDLVLGEPFETGIAAWTAPARTAARTAARADVVVKLSYPHREARDEAAALAAWRGAGAVEVLGADADDWALLLRRLRPGSTLRDERLPTASHLAVGAELLRRLTAVPVPAGEPFSDLVEVADRLALVAAERVERLLPVAPIPIDAGLCRHAVDLLRTLPATASRRGLAHGDFNPGNILRHDDAVGGWLAIDPKPVHGDLAWDPWPLLTQLGDWTVAVPDAADLASRARLVADVTGLDATRMATWCVARGVESGLWAADRGWWTGFRGADGDLARAEAWADATTLLGD